MHQLDENIKELDKDLDTHHLKLSNNHGDFIHEFVFSKYLAWLQTLINNKLTVHFGFIKENRKNINQIDVEFHQLRNEFNALKADYEKVKADYLTFKNGAQSQIADIKSRLDNLENK